MWLLIISHPSVKFDSHKSRENEFITFFVCYITLWDHVINRLRDIVDNRASIITHHSVKFLSHSSHGNRNITFFISHVSLDHVLKASKDLMNGGPLLWISTFFKFGSHSLGGSGDISFFICQVTSCDHVSAGSRNFAGCGPSA